jgi:hypothetical protein
MGVKKIFRGAKSSGAPGAGGDEAASIGITSVECADANFSDLVSPMKGPSLGASGKKPTVKGDKGKAGWPAGIWKLTVGKKKKSLSGSSYGTFPSDSPRNAACVPSEDPINDANGVAAASTSKVGRSVKFADEGSIVAPLHTTKLIDGASSTNNEADIAGRARAKSVKPSPGGGYVGFPPTTLAEAEQHYRRVLIMLLSPQTQEFEIIAIYYDRRERTGLANIIRKIPRVATSKCFSDKARSQMRYRGLTRVQWGGDAATSRSTRGEASGRGSSEPGEELISVLSLADYDIQPDEMLAAIPNGFEGRVIASMAASLLTDGRVQKLVNRIVRTNQLPPPLTLCGRLRKSVVRSKRKVKRRLEKCGIGQKLMGSLLILLALVILMHFLVSAYLPMELQEIDALFRRAVGAFWE